VVNFSKPTIGPRMYMSLGPSGWVEAFPRREADAELKLLVDHPALAVEAFIRARRTDKQPVSYTLIIEFLAALCMRPAELLPTSAIIAFWAGVIRELEAPQSGN